MDKNTKSGTGVKGVEKKLDGDDGMLGANPELRGTLPQLLRDDPRWRHQDRHARFA
jgi:hypothetical protein